MLLEVGAVMFLVQDNDRERRRRKWQHDLGAVTVMAGVMVTMTVVMFDVVSAMPMPVVVMAVLPAIPMPVIAIVVATCVALVTVATVAVPAVRGERRRGEGQGGDQQCDSYSLGAIHG